MSHAIHYNTISEFQNTHKFKILNVNLDYPLHVLYDKYNVCVAHLTDKLIFYGPHKPSKKCTVFKTKCMFNLKFVFVNNFTIGSLFKFKDCLSLDMKSHVVYRLDCVNCSAGYIGVVTTRLLPARVQEHRDALKGVRSSAVADHSLRMGHDVDWSNVKILASDSNEQNLFYLESLLILKHRPTLNKMQTFVNIIYLHNFMFFIYRPIRLYAYNCKLCFGFCFY